MEFKLSPKAKIIAETIKDGGRSTFGIIVAIVPQKMTKTGNPLAGRLITKEVKYHSLFNTNYTKVVNAQRKRERCYPTFRAQENWHEKVIDKDNGSLVRHKTKNDLYLSVIVKKAEVIQYFVDGQIATPEEMAIIKEFRQVSKAPQNQGYDFDYPLQKPVIFRVISLDNIRTLKANGKVLTF